MAGIDAFLVNPRHRRRVVRRQHADAHDVGFRPGVHFERRFLSHVEENHERPIQPRHVGGGEAALRKVRLLRAAGADVLVVAPNFSPPLELLAEGADVEEVEQTSEAPEAP